MPLPSIDFLYEASACSLQDLEITSLNRSANLSKTIRVELEEWIDLEATAKIARWMSENREALLRGRPVEMEPQSPIGAPPRKQLTEKRKEKSA